MSLSRILALTTLSVVLSCSTIGCDDSEASPPTDADEPTADTSDLSSPEDAEDVASDPDPTDSSNESEVGPNPVWSNFDNECAPERRVIEPERAQAGSPPMAIDDEPQLLWQRSSLCPDAPAEQFDAVTRQDFAYGWFDIDGTRRDVVAVLDHGYDPDVLGPIPVALAILDADTGDPIECMDLSHEAHIVDRALRIVSGEAIYVSYTTQRSEAAEELGIPDVLGLAAYRPGEGELFERRIEIPQASQEGPATSVTTSDGQVIVNWKNSRLISFDYETGDVYWTIGGDAFSVPESGFNLKGPHLLGENEVVVQVSDRWFTVDRCGQPTNLGFEGGHLLSHGDATVHWTSNRVRIHGEDSDITFSERCDAISTIDSERIVCMHRRNVGSISNKDWRLELKIFDPPSGEVETITIEPPSSTSYSRIVQLLLAAADDVVIGSGSYRFDGDDQPVTRYYVYSASELEELYFFDIRLDEDDQPAGSGSSAIPVLTPDGKFIVPLWGSVYTFQTGIAGLSNSEHPRGLFLGGNENRMYVEPN
jgi:hypothetical protein